MSLFSRRLRGFRIIDLFALTVLLVVAVTSYALKTLASAQGADTAQIEARMAAERSRIRLLQAEISHLEDPERIERLATDYLHMSAVDAAHEARLADLPRIARDGAAPVSESSPPAAAATPAVDPTIGTER